MSNSVTQAFLIDSAGTYAGRTAYVDKHDAHERVFYHTEVLEEFAGRGLAAALVDRALTQTAAEGLDIVAACPYVATRLSTHPGCFPHNWRKPTPDDLAWLELELEP